MAVPKVSDLIVPTFIALRDLGGSGRNAEIRSLVAENLEISEEDQQMPQGQRIEMFRVLNTASNGLGRI